MSQPSRPSFLPRFVAGLLLFAVVALAFPTATWAAGTYCDWTYYSDATYTTIVGEKIKTCQNQVYSWGIVTTFKLGGCEPCGPLGLAQSTTDQAALETRPLDFAPTGCLTPAR